MYIVRFKLLVKSLFLPFLSRVTNCLRFVKIVFQNYMFTVISSVLPNNLEKRREKYGTNFLINLLVCSNVEMKIVQRLAYLKQNKNDKNCKFKLERNYLLIDNQNKLKVKDTTPMYFIKR